MLYQIRLKLTVDDKDVDKAIAKVNALKGGNVGTSPNINRRIPQKNSYSNIPDHRVNFYRNLSTKLGRLPITSNQGFMRNVNSMYGEWNKLSRNFLGNMATPSGILRNISNFGASIGAVGKVASKAIPAVSALAMALKAIAAIKAVSIVGNLAPLWIGNKLLGSESMRQAGSNLMQIDMAKKGLGGYYKSAMNRATQLSAEYGYDRIGMLNAMTLFQGLKVNGKPMSVNEAESLARISGKISHAGGVPFEKVSTNLQQLLAQQVPSMRDIRELVGQATFVGKLSMNMMERQGKTGDYREWLKEKSNLISVLNELDKMIQSNPVMEARGKIAVAKENFWMRLAGNSSMWEKTAQGMEIFYGKLGEVAGSIIQTLATQINPERIAKSINDIAALTKGIMWMVSALVDTGNAIGGLWGKIKGGFAGAAKGYATTGNMSSHILNSYYPPKRMNGISQAAAIIPQGHIAGLDNRAKISALIAANVPSYKWASLMDDKNFRSTGGGRSFGGQGFVFAPQSPSLVNNIAGANTGANTSANASNEITDLTKGSRSLIINFNKEIVNMPVNIDTLNSGEDLMVKLQRLIPDMIVRGMNIALNNATSAI